MPRCLCNIWAILALFVMGCGGSEAVKPLDMGGVDGDKISALIEDMNDAVGNPKKLTPMFVSGAKTPDAAKTKGVSFSIVGKPAVEGTSAKAKVRMDKNSAQAGEVEWTFEKVGDQWKIKSAPLQ